MANVEFELKHGYVAGLSRHKTVVLREPTAGDVIEANEESEKLVALPEPMFIASPTLVGINVLRRQIVKVGDISGPFSIKELKNFHPEDLDIVQTEANKMEAAWAAVAANKGVVNRGRDNTPGADNQ